MEVQAKFGSLLRKLREDANLTQEKLAEEIADQYDRNKSGFPGHKTVNAWENGTTRPNNQDIVMAIIRALKAHKGVDPKQADELLRFVDDSFGVLLRQLRREANLTMGKLSEEITHHYDSKAADQDVSKAVDKFPTLKTVDAWEHEKATPDNRDKVIAIIRALKVYNGIDLEQANRLLRLARRFEKLQPDEIQSVFGEGEIGSDPADAPVDPPDSGFIGRKELIQNSVNAFLGQGNFIIGIEGLGGSGKTELARQIYAMCQQARHFDHAIAEFRVKDDWQQQKDTFTDYLEYLSTKLNVTHFGALGQEEQIRSFEKLLGQKSVLLFVDNLETAYPSQTEFVEQLTKVFKGHCKVILTSRRHFGVEVDQSIRLQGLPEQDAINLIRQEAQREPKVFSVINAHLDELKQIYQITGGHPLAIRLIVGLMNGRNLNDLLTQTDNLRLLIHVRPDENEMEIFYYRILAFSWRLLSQNSKEIMYALGASGEGVAEEEDILYQLTHLNQEGFRESINKLWQYALVEISEKSLPNRKRYYLHPVVHAFVRSNIPPSLDKDYEGSYE